MTRKLLRALTALTAVLFVFSMVAWSQSSNSSKSDNSKSASSKSDTSKAGSRLSSSDKRFLEKAAEGGKAEVELGQLAEQKAQSKDVKDFGQRMVNDHTKANEQLKQVAERENVKLPDAIDRESASLKNRLEKLSGAQFDKAYMNAMVKDHTKDVQEFKKEASSGQDPEVKSFARATTPTLEQHLNMAKQIDSKAGSHKAGGQ